MHSQLHHTPVYSVNIDDLWLFITLQIIITYMLLLQKLALVQRQNALVYACVTKITSMLHTCDCYSQVKFNYLTAVQHAVGFLTFLEGMFYYCIYIQIDH